MSQKLYKVEDIQLLFKELKVEIKKLKCFIEDCCSKIPINIGTGATLFKRLYRDKWEFKSLLPGSNITITEQDDTITINSTGSGGGLTCEELAECPIIEEIQTDISNKWDLSGNSISNTDFIGSTNNQDFTLKVGNEPVYHFSQYGVNIGYNITPKIGVSIGNNVISADGYSVTIGESASTTGAGGVAIGYNSVAAQGALALGVGATALANQFALPDTMLYAKWRGIPYEFPSLQGAASTVLTNNGAGVLSWQTNGAGSVTSVGLTMPTAFSVANSPVTTTGTLAVTATGNASQYIRGDGALGILPESSGGAGGVVYYFNGNTASSIVGSFEMSKTPDTGVPANFSKTGDGLIVSFATNANDPNITEIPGGIWLFKPYLSMATNVGSPKINTQVKIFDGIGYTTIATSDTFLVSNGTATSLYTFGIVIPQTTTTITDRIVVEFYLSNSLGDTITLYTEDSFINSVATTIPSGIATLNGLNTTTQYLATGTTGTDFNISSATNTHTFNIPTASAINRGLLSTADWSTFNGKQNALGYTPEDVANKENTTLDTSTTKYPTNNLVKTYVDTQIGNAPILISTATASTSATIDFTLPSGYNSFEVKVISLIPSTDNVAMWIRVSTDGGATFAAGASDYVYQRNIQNGNTAVPVLSSPDTKIVTLGGAIGNGSGRYFNSIIKVFDPSNASINKNISVDFYAFRSDSVYSIGFVNGVYKFNTAINAIRILMSSGNIASGTFELWGYK
jgi:hypothetical protein